MNSTQDGLNSSGFTKAGRILYHSLDMVKGTFEIRNTSKKLVAEVKDLETKTHLFLLFKCTIQVLGWLDMTVCVILLTNF